MEKVTKFPKFLIALLIITLTLVIFPSLYSVSNPFKTLINIKDINYDCVPDTLVGTYVNSTLKLNYILWGIDSTIQAFPKDYNWVDTTFIHYPNWTKLRSYINISSFNIDTVPDIMILVRGKIEIDSQLVDTTIKVIIYGQYGFDSVSNITLSNIAKPIQDIPFKAKHVITSEDLSNCQIRGYDFTKVSEFAKSTTSFPPPIFKDNHYLDTSTSIITLIYPNPSQSSIILKTDNFDLGRYTIDIISINGEFLSQRIVDVLSKSADHSIDISKLTNGSYYLVISYQNRIIRTVKFIKNI